MPEPQHDYRFETFPAALDPASTEGDPDARTAAFVRAVRAGFYDSEPDAERLRSMAASFVADHQMLTAAYPASAPEGALSAEVPVATFVTFGKRINTGHGRQLGAHLITGVTVRPTHRRRGLLRRLMETDLRAAAAAGKPLAALTASEGSIYSRFGFGPVEWQSEIEIDASPGLAFRVEPSGRVELAEPAAVKRLAPQIYARFQERTPGALERKHAYWRIISGELDPESGKPDPAVRAAVHYDPEGAPDGYVTYKFTGWEPPTVKVIDLIAVSDEAYRSLWQFLGTLDLVQVIRYGDAARDSALPWLLADGRRMRTKTSEDGVWLRLLDLPAAFEGRGWGPVSATLRLRVSDRLGFTAGTWELTVADGTARVEALSEDAPADLALDTGDLASLYLGGADAALLARAGRLTELAPGAAVRARSLLALERPPYAPSHF
ncbi:GNAT family N-acetyltransferase [Sediminivirga luteola]|uniref:UPF0256 protein n=1 Tax=Sediminivirga luteola TaxID=1774748 RepID=A0A8J2TV66_9MICO|nr:GNAT family N-acetyltransferase [Sediminivirga luteola]GGA02838.1 UPF0256 protein [Sediminivirga luteola]